MTAGDRKLRELERAAKAGNQAAARQLAHERFRRGACLPSFGGDLWRVRFQPSAVGMVFHSAKKLPHGRVLTGRKIPPHVAEQVGATLSAGARQLVLDPDIASVVQGAKPLPVEWVTRSPPRIVCLLRPARYRPGLVVELAKLRRPRRRPHPPAPDLDWDDAHYLGDGEDGVYFAAVQASASRWWAMADVDSNTGGFTDSLVREYGYRSRRAALQAARDAAMEWLDHNGVEHEEW